MSLTLLQQIQALLKQAAQEALTQENTSTNPATGRQWLAQPYYLAPIQVRVGNTVAVVSILQMMLQSTMQGILNYLNPNATLGLTARTQAAIVADYIATAEAHAAAYPATDAGVNLAALGTQYGDLQVQLMQNINSGDGVTSIWDAWVAMTEPVK